METYTIAKILFSKEVEGRYGMQHNVRFTTNETGEQSISCFSKFPLKEGQQITGSIAQKTGTNKEGVPVVYHNFNFAKKDGGSTSGGMNPDQFTAIMRELHSIRTNILRIWQEVDPTKGFTSDGNPVPDFMPPKEDEVKEVKEAKPESFPVFPTRAETYDEFAAADIPFD